MSRTSFALAAASIFALAAPSAWADPSIGGSGTSAASIGGSGHSIGGSGSPVQEIMRCANMDDFDCVFLDQR